MKKVMKMFAAMLGVAMMVSAVSCSKDDEASYTNDQIVGTWDAVSIKGTISTQDNSFSENIDEHYSVGDMYITFNADGTGVSESRDDEEEATLPATFHWSLSGNKIVMVPDQEDAMEVAMPIEKLEGNTMVLHLKQSMDMGDEEVSMAITMDVRLTLQKRQ
jgi:hypothetical protein